MTRPELTSAPVLSLAPVDAARFDVVPMELRWIARPGFTWPREEKRRAKGPPRWSGRTATLAAIKAAAESGTAIEPGSLPNAPTFRFVPAEKPDAPELDPYGKGSGTPSKLKPVPYRCANPACLCHKAKSGWRHKPLEPGPRYAPGIARPAGLDRALRAYERGDPEPLRDWLRRTNGPRPKLERKLETVRPEPLAPPPKRTSGRLIRKLAERRT